MNGLDMMLKSMGLDPVALKEQADGIGKLIATIAESLQRIEAGQQAIDAKLTALLAVNGTPAPVPAVPQITTEVQTHA